MRWEDGGVMFRVYDGNHCILVLPSYSVLILPVFLSLVLSPLHAHPSRDHPSLLSKKSNEEYVGVPRRVGAVLGLLAASPCGVYPEPLPAVRREDRGGLCRDLPYYDDRY